MAAPKTPAPKPSASAAILAAPLPAASSGTTDYLGMPANTADTSGVVAADQAAQAQWAQGKTAPAYANGAQYLPVMQNWSPQDIAAVQARMVNSGLLSNTDYRAGVWDAASQKAFAEVLGTANNMGRPWQEALTQYESGTPMQWDPKTGSYVQGAPGTARTKAPVVTNFTSPDDLATTAQEVATNKLGRTFTPQELQKFIAAYHGTEQSAQSALSAGQSYTSPASPTAAATTFAEQADPTAYNAEKFLPMVARINQLIAGPNLSTTKPQSV